MPPPLNLPQPGPGPIIRPYPSRDLTPSPVQGQDAEFIQLVRHPIGKRFFSRSKLSPPAVVNPAVIFPAARMNLVDIPRNIRTSHSKLRPPAVIGPSVVFLPVRRTLAQQHRPQIVQSELRPPILAAVVSFVAAPIRATLAKA